MSKKLKNPLPWSLAGGPMAVNFMDANGQDIFEKTFWTDPSMKEAGSYIDLDTAKFIVKTVNQTVGKK